MLRFTIAMLLVVLIGPLVRAEGKPTEAAKQYQELLEEYEQEGGARIFAKRFLAFAKEHPGDSASVDALLWVVKKVPGRAETDSALKLLTDQHTNGEKLAAGCYDIARSRSAKAELLLRALVDKSRHRSVQAQACYYLAMLLDLEANISEQLKSKPELAPRVLQYYGDEYGKHLSSLDAAKLSKERESVYERLLKSFGDVKIQDTKLGDVAETMLFRIRHLTVGKVAPEIEGEDIAGTPFKLSDYRGKVVMLTFWGHW